MKEQYFSLVVMVFFLCAGLVTSCGQDEGHEKVVSYEEAADTTAEEACAKIQECFPADFEEYYPEGISACVNEANMVTDNGEGVIYCYEFCDTDVSCDDYNYCLDFCANDLK